MTYFAIDPVFSRRERSQSDGKIRGAGSVVFLGRLVVSRLSDTISDRASRLITLIFQRTPDTDCVPLAAFNPYARCRSRFPG